MLQTCIFRSTSPPGPFDEAIVGYHSILENGNLGALPPVNLLPDTHQQTTFPAKLERPMESRNYHTKKK